MTEPNHFINPDFENKRVTLITIPEGIETSSTVNAIIKGVDLVMNQSTPPSKPGDMLTVKYESLIMVVEVTQIYANKVWAKLVKNVNQRRVPRIKMLRVKEKGDEIVFVPETGESYTTTISKHIGIMTHEDLNGKKYFERLKDISIKFIKDISELDDKDGYYGIGLVCEGINEKVKPDAVIRIKLGHKGRNLVIHSRIVWVKYEEYYDMIWTRMGLEAKGQNGPSAEIKAESPLEYESTDNTDDEDDINPDEIGF